MQYSDAWFSDFTKVEERVDHLSCLFKINLNANYIASRIAEVLDLERDASEFEILH